MENIYNNYRNIVERAVFAGIITEESKDFYLSAIDDKNDSELSEVESLVNNRNGNANPILQKESYNLQSLLKSDTEEHNIIDKISGTCELNEEKCLQENQSILSGDTIENYSIFDLKIFKENSLTQESDSDAIASKHLEKERTVASTIPKVTKKPRKNEIVDFKVPIYINMKKKKAFIKPCCLENSEKKKCEKPCTYNCKTSSKSVSNKRRPHETSWALNLLKTKDLLEEKDSKSESTNFKTDCFNYSNIHTYELHQPNIEKNRDEVQKENRSVMRKSVYSCSKQKGLTTTSKLNEDYVLQNCDAEPHNTVCCCRENMRPKTLLRRSKPHEMSHQQEPVTNLKYPMKISNTYLKEKEHGCVRKVLPLNKKKSVAKCKRCKYICNCKNMEHVPNPKALSKDLSDDESSVLEVPVSDNTSEGECNRLLNVNIICQFYPDVEKGKLQSAGGHESENELKDTSTEEKISEAQDSENATCEAGKTVSNKTIQRLSNMFTNIKIKRKLKKED